MKKASFTVVKKGIVCLCSDAVLREQQPEVRYDADCIMSTFQDGDLRPMISFICSGRMTVLPAAEVDRIEFHYDDPNWSNAYCSHCDQPLPSNMFQAE